MMRMTRICSCVFSLLLILILVTPAAAQLEGAALGDVYLSFATDYYLPFNLDPIHAFETVTFYLLVSVDYGDIGLPAENNSNGIKAWEVGVEVPPEILIESVDLEPETSLNFGTGISDWIVGVGQVLSNTKHVPYVLGTYRGVLLSYERAVVIDFAPVSHPSFTPAEAGWFEAHPVVGLNECVNPLTGNPQACLRRFATENRVVVNCDRPGNPRPGECFVAIEPTSWGAVKASFAH